MCRNDHRSEPTVYAMFHAAAAVVLTLLSTGSLPAHQSPSRQSESRSTHDRRRADLEASRRALLILEKGVRRSVEKPTEQRLAYQQIKEDFELLQVVNYQLYVAAGSDSALDYRQIRKDLTEVRKRASRLKTNLMLPEPEKGEKQKKNEVGLTAEELRSAITALHALVRSFVTNPIFQTPGVVDAQQSAKARADLEEVIKLSEQIRRSAEALSK